MRLYLREKKTKNKNATFFAYAVLMADTIQKYVRLYTIYKRVIGACFYLRLPTTYSTCSRVPIKIFRLLYICTYMNIYVHISYVYWLCLISLLVVIITTLHKSYLVIFITNYCVTSCPPIIHFSFSFSMFFVILYQ